MQCAVKGPPLIFEKFCNGKQGRSRKTADPHTELAGTLTVVHGLPPFGVLKPNSQKVRSFSEKAIIAWALNGAGLRRQAVTDWLEDRQNADSRTSVARS
jgi:hypothetical protein